MKYTRRILCLMLSALMLLSALACGNTSTAETTTAATETTTVATSATSDTELTTVTTEAPIIEVPTGPRLIYAEDFEGQKRSVDSDAVLAALGWVKDTTQNGAYNNNTTAYSIVNKDGSRQLALKNNKSGGTDSYVTVLSAALMGKLHEKNYTYQYDICYESANDTARYIALVSEYDGQFYNSFHLRMNGSANNQCHASGSWLTYDAAGELYAAAKDNTSIATKLLGTPYKDGNTLKDLSLSIRYVVDWEQGNSVYVRLNTAGYDNTGKWILVSRADPTGNATGRFTPETGGAALVLKTGTRIDGYVDNILVWEGTGEEPTDKSAPLVTSKTEGCSGHTYLGTGNCADPSKCRYCGALSETNSGHIYTALSGVNDKACSVCGALESAVAANWPLTTMPPYAGGTPGKSLYAAGHGIADAEFLREDDSQMITVANTNESQFNTYRTLLTQYGAREVYSYACDGNLYAQYRFGDTFAYVYYTAATKEVRIIDDPHSELSPAEFGYSYQKKAGDTTVLYQYGVPMNEAGVNINNNDEKKIDCGMMYVIKLADNSVFILDGGGYQQFDEAQIDGFMKFLRTVTGTPEGQKVKIAAWHISHAHSDHMAGFCLFVKKYHEQLDFDRLFYNFPSANSTSSTLAGQKNNIKKMMDYVDKYLKDDGISYIKIHTGQQFDLADIRIHVLYTHEDIVNAHTGISGVGTDFNNSSSVLMIELDGKKFLFLGDINNPAANVLMKNNSAATLTCDIIQLAHHVINDLSTLYHITKAPAVLVPQSPNGATLNQTRKNAMDAAKQYVTGDLLFYANQATVGLQVKNGAIAKVFQAPVDGDKYTGWSW